MNTSIGLLPCQRGHIMKPNQIMCPPVVVAVGHIDARVIDSNGGGPLELQHPCPTGAHRPSVQALPITSPTIHVSAACNHLIQSGNGRKSIILLCSSIACSPERRGAAAPSTGCRAQAGPPHAHAGRSYTGPPQGPCLPHSTSPAHATAPIIW